MKFNDFANQIKNYPVFDRPDLKTLFPEANFSTLNKQFSSWVAKKYLIRLKNGLYLLSPRFLPYNIQPHFLAAKIHAPSYLSLEYALSFYGLIPEATFVITSVTTKLPRRFVTPLGTYSYRHVKPEYFFGFQTRRVEKLAYYLAEKEKAILDYLYLNSARFTSTSPPWQQLRLDHLDSLDFNRLGDYVRRFKDKKLLNLTHSLKAYAKSR